MSKLCKKKWRGEVQFSKYRIPKTEGMAAAKNQAWLKEAHKRDYQNQKYLEETDNRGEKILSGLESESIPAQKLTNALEVLMAPMIGKTEEVLKISQLKILNDAIRPLILHKIT